jgi:hypothetical protein
VEINLASSSARANSEFAFCIDRNKVSIPMINQKERRRQRKWNWPTPPVGEFRSGSNLPPSVTLFATRNREETDSRTAETKMRYDIALIDCLRVACEGNAVNHHGS